MTSPGTVLRSVQITHTGSIIYVVKIAQARPQHPQLLNYANQHALTILTIKTQHVNLNASTAMLTIYQVCAIRPARQIYGLTH